MANSTNLAKNLILDITPEVYQTLFDKSPIGIALFDVDGRFVSFNDALLIPGGYSRSDLEDLESDHELYCDPDEREKLISDFREGQVVEGREVRLKKKHGSFYYASVSLAGTSLDGKPCTMALVEDITQRKQAEQETQKYQRLLDAAESLAKLGSWEIDLKTQMVKWSRESYNIYELDPEKPAPAIHESFELLEPEDRALARDRFNRAVKGKDRTPPFKFRMITPSGQAKYLLGNSKLETDAKGKAARLIGTVQDITELHQAEEASKRYQGLLETAQALAKLGHWELDLVTSDLEWSPECYKIYGLEPEGPRVTLEQAFGFMASPDREIAQQTVADLISGRTGPNSLEFKIKTPSRKDKYLIGRSHLIRDINGQPAKLIGTVQDITEQKLSEMALVESEARNKKIVENVHEAIMLFDPRTKRFVSLNHKAVEMFGYSEEELMEKTPLSLSPELQPDGSKSADIMKRVLGGLKKGDRPVLEWVHLNAEGREFLTQVYLVIVPFEHREMVMACMVDITKRRAQERERESLISELDRFVYSASHDLSAPLKSLLGLINLARVETQDETQKNYLDRIAELNRKVGKLHRGHNKLFTQFKIGDRL